MRHKVKHHCRMTSLNAHPLAVARRQAGLSQMMLAVEAGTSLPTVQRAERGTGVSQASWDAFARVLSVDVAAIRHDSKDSTTAGGATGNNTVAAAA